MKLSAAYGLVAIGALALLTSVQWARTTIKPAGELLQFAIGVLPNLLRRSGPLLSSWHSSRTKTADDPQDWEGLAAHRDDHFRNGVDRVGIHSADRPTFRLRPGGYRSDACWIDRDGAAVQTRQPGWTDTVTDQPTELPSSAEATCTNCHELLHGEYCSRCGQKRFDPHQLTLKYFAKEAAAEVTDFEHSKLLRSLRLLFVRPGFLTNEWLTGRRKSYISPLKIFLIGFALTFFLYTVYQPVAVYDLRTMIAAIEQVLIRKSWMTSRRKGRCLPIS